MTTTAPAPGRARAARRVLLGPAVALVALGAGGCGAVSAVNSSLTGVESRHFDVRADAPQRGDLAFVLPDAVPQDATDVSVTVKTDTVGVVTYAWTSAQDPPASCAAASGTPSPPLRSPKGFPGDLDAGGAVVGGAVVCDGLVEVRDGDRTYAWLDPDGDASSSGTSG